jgi:hypothetical protein
MRRAFAAALGAAFSFCGLPAAAQVCSPYESVRRALFEQHGESAVGAGHDDRDVVVQLFATSDGATWTLVIVRPDGIACLVASGQEWRRIAGPPLGRPS